MRTFALGVLTLFTLDLHAQAQCEKLYVEKCARMKQAAGNFQPEVSAGSGGTRELQQAQSDAFAQAGNAWQSALKTCVDERNDCVKACAETKELCKQKIDPMIQEANAQMLTNQDQSRVAIGQQEYTDDMGEHDRKLAQDKAQAESGAKVEQVGGLGSISKICPKNDNECFNPENGDWSKLQPNGNYTVEPGPGRGNPYSTWKPPRPN